MKTIKITFNHIFFTLLVVGLFVRATVLQLPIEDKIEIVPYQLPIAINPLDTMVFSSIDYVESYIQRFKSVVVNEQEKYKIPASIIMAQGLLESNFGRSQSSLKYNNHFGVKSGSQWKGKTYFAKDDDYIKGKLIKSKFRVYNTAWESYRDHSKFLLKDRYKPLFEMSGYEEWARGLQKCGYATDKNYANKLISIIRKYKLYKLDYT